MEKINLGDKVKDSVTGFSGIVTSNTEYLNGCNRIGIQSDKLLEGKPSEIFYFDMPQCILVKKSVINRENNNGGWKEAPKKMLIQNKLL